MPLVLIESPNKVSKLKEILGAKYKIMASVGHIMDLEKKNMGIDLETFDVVYKQNKEKKEVISNIKKEAENHDIIYIATDPDREGEAIGFNLESILPKGKTIHRVKFNAITKDVVLKAIKNPEVLDQNLYLAQKARRVTDRVVGFKVSPVMWNKGLVGTSAGRVQSVALKFIVDKEKEIKAFIPEDYWSVMADFKNGLSADFWGLNSEKTDITTKVDADDIVSRIKGSKDIKVSDVQSGSRSRKPAPPFTTSTLQQAASSSFGWSAKKTMDVAQSIFSSGLITYHRTDSIRIEDTKITDVRERIEDIYGKKYLAAAPIKWGAKEGAQDAHEAIRPTFEEPLLPLQKDEQKLLDLITGRFMASQMADAEFDQVAIQIEVTDTTGVINFKKSGQTTKFDGFLKAYGSKTDDVSLPQVKVTEALALAKVKDTKHVTKAPPRFTDASIIKVLEKEGVGRPSTYAAILDTLSEREYIKRSQNSLTATDIGIIVSDYLNARFPKIVDPKFTSKMEENLDKIADGELSYKDTLKAFYESLIADVDVALKGGIPDSLKVDITCPKCNMKMIKRISKHGAFLGCMDWPTCNGTLSISGEQKKEGAVDVGHKCPECSNILILRTGKNGQFFGCKSYPDCKVTAACSKEGTPIFNGSDDSDKEKCDKCANGVMEKRKGKYGFFLGCSAYPKCKNIKKIAKESK